MLTAIVLSSSYFTKPTDGLISHLAVHIVAIRCKQRQSFLYVNVSINTHPKENTSDASDSFCLPSMTSGAVFVLPHLAASYPDVDSPLFNKTGFAKVNQNRQ